ncbi:MAG: cell division protein ZapA [Rhodospirillaceae bacterium]|nr:cell division protein ZapA [Rhodospirillaceae bacterium]
MSEVTITVNRRPYRLACEDGQERHLMALAERIDKRVGDLVGRFGQIGDQQLLVMVGLLLADEAADLRRRLDEQSDQAGDQAAAIAEAERAAAAAIEETAERIERLAESVERTAEDLTG